MPWLQLTLVIPRERTDAAAEALAALGSAGHEVSAALGEPGLRQVWDTVAPQGAVQLRAWFEDPNPEAVEAGLRAALGEISPSWEPVADTDWGEAWKAEWKPLTVLGTDEAPRLVLAPPWDAPPGSLVIEPGQGFGTGRHPTTLAMLRALEDVCGDVETVLDVGCGSGILALVAARLGCVARGIDVEPAAVEEARANAARNGLSVAFESTRIDQLEEGADLVLANMHAELLVSLAPDLIRLTRSRLILCGVLEDREPLVRTAFAELEPDGREQSGRWVCLRYRRATN